MSNLQLQKKPPSPEADVEVAAATGEGPSSFGANSVLRRWKREDLLKRGSIVLRGMSFVFSLLSFIIMATNNHGDWKEFGKYEEYRYLLGIAILSTIYTGGQCYRHFHHSYTGIDLLPSQTSPLIDFVGDQIIAYFLLSSASSAIPLTNRMREGSDNIFTDSSATAISMSILAFFVLASSSIIAGYKLCTQSFL